MASTAFWKSISRVATMALHKARGSLIIDPRVLHPKGQAAKSKLSDEIRHTFNRQRRLAVAEIKKHVHTKLAKAEPKTPDEIAEAVYASILEEFHKLPEATTEAYTEAVQSGVTTGLAQLNIDDADMINSVNAIARDWARDRAAELVGMTWDENDNLIVNPKAEWAITETTRDELRRIVTEAFEQETPLADLIASIEDAGSFSSSRAEMIARTEVAFSQVTGNYEVWQASGAVAGVRWLISDDHEIEDECDDNDGEIAELGDPFPSGDLMPPAHPNCWCALVAVFSEDMPDAETATADSESADDADKVRKAEVADCDWVTINGEHICIGQGGAVMRGPAALVGQNVRNIRAKLAYVPATKERQDVGDEWQHKITKALAGEETADNLPVDVVKGNHGIEVKTIQVSKKDRVEMRPDSRARKEEYAKVNNVQLHTVAVDLRGSKPVIYYKAGVGAFRFGTMEKVSMSELKAKFS